MPDTETLVDPEEEEEIKKPEVDSDFPSMGVDLLKKMNFKVAFFVFLLGIFIFSDVFIEALPDRYQDGLMPNTHGTFIQLLSLTVGYLIIDLLAQASII